MFPEEEIQKITNKIEEKLDQSVAKIFPVKGKKHTLKLEELKFGSTKALHSLKKQKEIKLKNRSLTLPVRAHLTLWDNLTGEKIDDKTVKIMRLPALTQRYTYLVDGNEYQASNQLRLKAGVYTKFANNGELQTQINVGNKPGFKIKMDPEDQILYISARSSNISLYAFLKGMGIKDSYMEQFLGKEILDTNRREKEHRTKKAVKNFAKKIVYSDHTNLDKAKEDIKTYFNEAEMDKETTEITLGKSFERVNADLILHAAQKLIKVMQNKEEEDDRDSLVFKKFMSVEDHLSERIDKSVDKIKRNVEYNVDNHEEIKKIVSPNLFNEPIKSFFTSSDITAATEITNPLAALGNYRKVTIMGEGGISSPNQLSDDMININPSQFGFLDPVHTPESQKIGANLHLGVATDIEDGELKTRVINAKTKEVEKISPKQMSESTVAFPDQYDKKKKKFKNKTVKVMDKKEVNEVDSSKVDYILLSDKSMFDHTTNLIPFLQNTQGNRAMMGGKMQEQALSLKNREAPLVQSAVTEDGSTFEESLGNNNAIKAPVAGEITSTDPLTIKKSNGDEIEIDTYNKFPLGGSSMVTHEIKVEVGDKVQKGELLADSNFTKDGTMALGTNLNVAFMPYKGYTFEDGLVISDSAAEKMRSEHLYTFEFEKDTNTTMDKERFNIIFPRELKTDNAQKMDDEGVIKKGALVKKGDKLLVALRKKNLTETDYLLKNIHKNLAPDQAPFTIEWDNENEGEVNEVVRNGNLIKIIVETEEKAKEGDKIVGRYGNKGTISKIIPDNEAPHNEDGKPVEIILNPHTVPSRMNPSQLLETAAGKIADKTGKPYKINNFSGEDYLDKIKKDLKKHGLSEKEKIIDPTEGELENPIFTGKQYFLKLKHQTKKKFSARGVGEGYDENEQPIQGGKSSGQSMDILTNYTLLAHGAKHNLKEMSTLKGQRNDEFWRSFQVGAPLPKLETPFVFDKFIDELKGLGVNVKKGEKHYQLMAMTDKDIEEMSAGEINDATIVRAKDLKEEKGGLFDPDITGGLDTEDKGKWSHINLEEPIPNPVFKNAIVSILGITNKKFNNVLAGDEKLNGKTGGEAIKDALSQVDIDEAIKEAKEEAKKTKSAPKKDRLHKRIRYLKALKKTDKRPEDYVLTKMPILPPKFRPVYELPNGSLNVSDINELYKHTILVNKALKQDKELGLLNEKEIGDMRKELFKSMEAVQGLSDPITNDAVRRGKKGILREIGGTSGTQPKNAFFQNRVMRKRQDLTGRSIIVAGPDLDIDTIGLPEEMAWNIFKPQVIRKLTQEAAIPGAEARDEHWEKRSETAKKMLKEVAEETPVILNRAPSLHKFSTMAFKPKLIEGKSIQLPSLVTGGFNADFDGDSCLDVGIYGVKDTGNSALTKALPNDMMYVDHKGEENKMAGHIGEVIAQGNYLTGTVDLEKFPRIEESKKVKDNKEIYDVPEGITVLSMDENGNKVWKPVSKFHIHKNLKMRKVKTSKRNEYLISDDHSLTHITDDLEVKKTVGDVGNIMPVVTKIQEPENPIEELNIKKGLYKVASKNVRMKDKIKLNQETGYTFGCYIGDGWTGWNNKKRPSQLTICNSDDELLTKVKNTISKWVNEPIHFGIIENPHDYDGHNSFSQKMVCHERHLSKLFCDLFGHGAENKHLPSWFINTSREFRLGLLAGLLDTDGTVTKVKAKSKNKSQIQSSYHTKSRELGKQIQLLLKSLGVGSGVSYYEKNNKEYLNVSISTVDLEKIKDEIPLEITYKKELLNEIETDPVASSRYDIVPLPKELGQKIRSAVGSKERKIYAPISNTMKRGYTSRLVAKRAIKKLGDEFFEEGLLKKWKEIVEDPNVEWARITKIEEYTKETTAYDITVPDVWTFTLASGLVVYDTMAVHVPVSKEAKEEALEKMLPSKNLFRPGHNNFMYTPGHEQILGLYYLTKNPDKKELKGEYSSKSEALKAYREAKKNKEKWSKEDPIKVNGDIITIGKIIVNQVLPKEYRKYDEAIDKGYLKNMFVELGEDEEFDNSKLADIANELKNLGNEHVYKRGFTVGISDLDIDKKKKDKIYDAAKKKVEKARKKPKEQAQKEIAKIMNEAEKKVYKQITDDNPDNAFVVMQRSGARGNEHNVRQILGGPGILADNKNEIVPVPVTKSYGEGIDTADYWTTMYGARKGMIDRAKSTAEPGAFNKELINNTLDHLVTEKDCGTSRGKVMKIYDKDAKNRFLAESVRNGGKIVANKNDLLNFKLLKELKKIGVDQVKVRTPLKCEAEEGLCSKCYGAFVDGQQPEIGDNIGIIAGEAMTEPTTQMTMNAFHSGGVMSNEEGKAQGMERLDQLFHMPKTLKGKATLATKNGVVNKINDTATGKEVFINGTKHFVPNKRKVTVKKGDSVKKGDKISSGVVKPQELMKLKGLDSVRDYLTDELSETYGNDIHKPTIETVVQKVTNLTKINDPGDSFFMEGQYAPLNKVEAINRKDSMSVEVEDAIGKTLAESVAGCSEGSVLTAKMVDKIKNAGNRKVKIKHKKISHSPELKGINQLPYYREDWMSKMNVGDIPRQFAESAAQGSSSKFKDTNNPIPAFAHGAVFGESADKY